MGVASPVYAQHLHVLQQNFFEICFNYHSKEVNFKMSLLSDNNSKENLLMSYFLNFMKENKDKWRYI